MRSVRGCLPLAGALCLLAIRYEHAPPPAQPMTMQTLLAGVRFVLGHKVVLGAMSLDLFAVLLGGATALLPMFAKDILHTGAWGLGLLRASPAVGALLMSLVLARWPVRRRTGPLLLGRWRCMAWPRWPSGCRPHLWARWPRCWSLARPT
jgi:hypothetical protein